MTRSAPQRTEWGGMDDPHDTTYMHLLPNDHQLSGHAQIEGRTTDGRAIKGRFYGLPPLSYLNATCSAAIWAASYRVATQDVILIAATKKLAMLFK